MKKCKNAKYTLQKSNIFLVFLPRIAEPHIWFIGQNKQTTFAKYDPPYYVGYYLGYYVGYYIGYFVGFYYGYYVDYCVG